LTTIENIIFQNLVDFVERTIHFLTLGIIFQGLNNALIFENLLLDNNANAKIEKWIIEVRFPGNWFEFDII